MLARGGFIFGRAGKCVIGDAEGGLRDCAR